MGFHYFCRDFGPALHLKKTSPLLPRCSSNFLEKNSVILLQTDTNGRQIPEGAGKKMDRGRRAMPVQNKPCYERHIQKCQDTHKQRLAKMKPRVDCYAPSSMRTFSKTNAKKHQIMEDRYTEIERDNRLLLEKMSQIMRKGGTAHNNDSAKYAKSLNREARKKRLQQITRENQRILHAIQQADPFYDHVKWAEEAQKNEAYMRNICQLPQALHPTRFEDTNTNIGGGAYKDDDSR